MADASAPVGVVLVGAGQRGRDVFGQWILANPHRLRLGAVVEPDPVLADYYSDRLAVYREIYSRLRGGFK